MENDENKAYRMRVTFSLLNITGNYEKRMKRSTEKPDWTGQTATYPRHSSYSLFAAPFVWIN